VSVQNKPADATCVRVLRCQQTGRTAGHSDNVSWRTDTHQTLVMKRILGGSNGYDGVMSMST
jgi:hypothetical protein